MRSADSIGNLAERSSNAYILFTSGSTGTPKGVPVQHSALDAFLKAFFAMPMDLGPNDRFLQMFDLTFDLSLMSYVAPLTIGASIYTVGDEGMKYMSIFQILEDHEITTALMVPSVLGHLRPFFDEIELPHLRYSLFCGEALSDTIATEWQQCVHNATIFNVYGPTEATIFCMTYRHSDKAKALNGIVCIGQPMRDMSMAVVDENGKRVPIGEKGELCLAGPQLTTGYWKNEEKSKEVFIDLEGTRFYRSGDVALEDEEGDFHYLGRVDQQVKIEGFRVELSEIEHWTRTICGIPQLAAVVHSNTMGANEIYVFIESTTPINEADIKDKLKQSIPSYMVPKKIITLERLPLNVNGKIDRKALKNSLLR
jgi:amino acid adenylation domain-containing protein